MAIHGGAELVVPLLEHGLIDELLLLVSASDVAARRAVRCGKCAMFPKLIVPLQIAAPLAVRPIG